MYMYMYQVHVHVHVHVAPTCTCTCLYMYMYGTCTMHVPVGCRLQFLAECHKKFLWGNVLLPDSAIILIVKPSGNIIPLLFGFFNGPIF